MGRAAVASNVFTLANVSSTAGCIQIIELFYEFNKEAFMYSATRQTIDK
jgi:hypothetical protein